MASVVTRVFLSLDALQSNAPCPEHVCFHLHLTISTLMMSPLLVGLPGGAFGTQNNAFRSSIGSTAVWLAGRRMLLQRGLWCATPCGARLSTSCWGRSRRCGSWKRSARCTLCRNSQILIINIPCKMEMPVYSVFLE